MTSTALQHRPGGKVIVLNSMTDPSQWRVPKGFPVGKEITVNVTGASVEGVRSGGGAKNRPTARNEAKDQQTLPGLWKRTPIRLRAIVPYPAPASLACTSEMASVSAFAMLTLARNCGAVKYAKVYSGRCMAVGDKAAPSSCRSKHQGSRSTQLRHLRFGSTGGCQATRILHVQLSCGWRQCW